MKQELDYYLVKRFPEIFKNRHNSDGENGMSWGIECGEGWFHILSNICATVENHITNIKTNNQFKLKIKKQIEAGEKVHEAWLKDYEKDKLAPSDIPEFTAVQIKEKFGTLRFYYSGGDEFISGVVSAAEAMSSVTCEVCGNAGKVRGGNWIKTLCDTHAEEKNQLKKEEVLNIGDIVYALVKGGMKEIIIKEIKADTWIGKQYSNDYDNQKQKYMKMESEENYSIKKVNTDIMSYYDATLVEDNVS